MNYTKEVVDFVRMLSALQSSSPSLSPIFPSDSSASPSSAPSLSLSSSATYFSSSTFGQSILTAGGKSPLGPDTELLYGHIEPTLHYMDNGNGSTGFGGEDGEDLTPDSATVVSYFTIFWAVMFSVMLSFACLGNILVIWIVLAHRRMRSVTNYFLLNLSVADLTMASLNGAPNSFYMLRHDWIFGSFLCAVNNYVASFTVASCVFTMMAISLDRYMAIVRPLQPRMTKGLAWKAIGAIWLFSAIVGLPCLIYSTTVTYFDGTSTKTKCFLLWPDGNPSTSTMDFMYTIFLLILTYIVPMTAMALCYGSMSLELWGHRQIGECTERQINSMISKRKVVRMFIVIVFVFATCWAPYHGYFIYVYYNKSIVEKRWIPAVYLAFYFLAMSTSCSNVIVYYFMNTKFRSYIQEVARNFWFCGRKRRRREFIGETPPLFRRYSQSNSRSRSGPTDENHIHNSPCRKIPIQSNIVLQNHINCYRNPVQNHHVQVTVAGRHHQLKHVSRITKKNGAPVHQNSLKTCNTYC